MTQRELAALNELLRANTVSDQTIEEARRQSSANGRKAPLPAHLRVREDKVGGVPGVWVDQPGAREDHVLLYLHGGAFVIGEGIGSAKLAGELAGPGEVRAFSLDYRLAPENPFPAAIDDVVAAYRALLGKGIKPEHIAFAGDSAGGGLAIAALLSVKQQKLPMPACCHVISAWLDMTLTGDSMDGKVAGDVLLSRERLAGRRDMYVGKADKRDPRASPIFADLKGLPPILLQAGSAEVLLDDSVRFAARAAAADVRVTLDIWPGVPHDFPRWADQLSEGRDAIAAAGRFLAEHL